MDVCSALRQLRGGGVVRVATREVGRMAKAKAAAKSKQSQGKAKKTQKPEEKKAGPSPPLPFPSSHPRGPRLRVLRQVQRALVHICVAPTDDLDCC